MAEKKEQPGPSFCLSTPEHAHEALSQELADFMAEALEVGDKLAHGKCLVEHEGQPFLVIFNLIMKKDCKTGLIGKKVFIPIDEQLVDALGFLTSGVKKLLASGASIGIKGVDGSVQ